MSDQPNDSATPAGRTVAASTAPAAISVSRLTERMKGVLEREIDDVWVEGQLSDLFTSGPGHIYFNLKDDKSQIKCAMFRGFALRTRFAPKNGLQVLVRGSASIYLPRGECQLILKEMIPKGIGPLELAFQQLQEELGKKGYFAAERKRPLPRFPRAIAMVTSPGGAAIRDMLENLARRWPIARVTVVPALVQGEGAADSIAAGIQAVNSWKGESAVEVMIIGRGGGSTEDLWAFNERVVADAVFRSKVPVISAVGHENDVTISDMVADHRALTPTHAIQDLVPDRAELLASIQSGAQRLNGLMQRYLSEARKTVDQIAARRVFAKPLDRLQEEAQSLDERMERFRRAIALRIRRDMDRTTAVAGRLEALSPLRVLGRGYSLTRSADGRLIRTPADVRPGMEIQTVIPGGSIRSTVIDAHVETSP